MEQWVSEWFAGLAFEPSKVYFTVALMMLLSSFGLPIPEEVTLLSAGLLAYMATHPHIYAPPYDGAVGVNPEVLAIVCFMAVFLSDLLVFSLGKFFGVRLRNSRRFWRIVKPEVFAKVEKWVSRYGIWMAGGFRFTPGVRFPGHMVCGMFGISVWKFMVMDGLAAMISVPTQILLISNYGEVIIEKIKEFKMILLWGGLLVILFFVGKKTWQWLTRKSSPRIG